MKFCSINKKILHLHIESVPLIRSISLHSWTKWFRFSCANWMESNGQFQRNICALLSEIRRDSQHDFSLSIEYPFNERAIVPFPFPICHCWINTIKQAGPKPNKRLDKPVTCSWNCSCTRIYNVYRFPSKKYRE